MQTAVIDDAGRDGNGVPRYSTRTFTPQETALLRNAFGVDDPHLLYLTDSSPSGVLTCDLKRDHGWGDEVYSFHLGFLSLRRPGESWREFQQRIQAMHRSDFPASARVPDTSLADLDPTARPLFEELIAAARVHGFDVAVTDGYRSPDREAYLMSLADGHTFTATSLHSYGRAVDFEITNRSPSTAAGRAEYVSFRRFVLHWGNGRLAIIGTPDQTWDWGHVEAPARWLGFHSIEDALAAARSCVPQRNAAPCVFPSRAAGAAR